MNYKDKVISLIEYFKEEFPDPKTDLYYTNPFTLLVACIMSAQATDKLVNSINKELFQEISSPQDIIDMGVENLTDRLKSLNLYRRKSQYIYNSSKIIQEQYNNQIPDNLKQLEQLPGVGLKTASVVLNVVFKHPVIPVDTHVFRIARNTGLSEAKTVLGVSKDLNNINFLTDEDKSNLHHWLVLHGRYKCKARGKNPACTICIVNG